MYQLIIRNGDQRLIISQRDTLTQDMKDYCDYYRSLENYGSDGCLVEIVKDNEVIY